jgi:hypothetical protein
MNERIKELANRLGPVATIGNWGRVEWADNVYPQLGDKMYASIDLEEFAELIVLECVAQIRPMWNQVKEVGAPPGYDYDTFDLAYNDCMNAIKEHFGVEE